MMRRIKQDFIFQYPTKNYSRVTLLLIAIFLLPSFSFAHTINYALEQAPAKDVVWYYLKLGFQHIIPSGPDHILFVISLCLLSTKISTIIWQASAFTVAHTITLALSMKNIIVAPPDLVEPIIALSICFVAVENLLITKLKAGRIIIVFLFGLIHGMGFASALNEIGLPRNKFYTSVFSFNVGVELGQMTIIVLVFALLIYRFGKKEWYRKFIVYPLSAIIAIIAAWWTIQRVFF
jgi:HupE / UreJ protein